MRRLLLLICFAAQAHASPLEEAKNYIPLAEVEGEPSTIVAGCVNVITGSYSIGAVDLSIVSAAPVTFQRTYSSDGWSEGNLSAGWCSNIYDRGNIFGPRDYRRYFCFLPEPSGGAPPYTSDKDQKFKDGKLQEPNAITYFKLNDPSFEYGMTNTGCGELSGRTNIKNQIVTYWPDTKSAELQLADGGIRYYSRCDRRGNQRFPMALLRESRPNGKQIHYLYDGKKATIRTTDATGQRVYGWYHIDRSGADPKHGPGSIKIRGSDGREVIYECHKRKNKGDGRERRLIHRAIPSDMPPESYVYNESCDGPDRIIRKNLPESRFQEIEYYHWKQNDVGDTRIRLNEQWDHHIYGRVRLLKAPVGHDSTPIITHRFFYHLPYVSKDISLFQTGSTVDVRDALNHKTTYTLQMDRRLREITRYTGSNEANYTPYSREYYFWGWEALNQNINLKSKVLYDGAGNIRSVRHLTYDDKHNVIADTICGNLSGNNTTSIQLYENGDLLLNGAECCVVRNTYSGDRFNLKTSQTLPNGRITTLRYKPESDLLVTKLIGNNQEILIREFTGYDAFGDVARTMTDDGSSDRHENHTNVTYRNIVDYDLRQEAPAVGLPETITERYMDPRTDIEHQLMRKVNTYSLEGRIVAQDVYDADNQHRYTLRWEYDRRGNITLEQNALGQLTQRKFDDNGNKIYEQGPDPSFHNTYHYDYSNRLISENRNCRDGVTLTQAYKYDYLGNKIASIDHFGQETLYRYDDFNRLIETILPPCTDANGQLVQYTLRQEYDIAGNVTALTDTNGNTTYRKYNIRGQPTEIIHPDGNVEYFVYNIDGSLSSQTAINQNKTRYTYDTLGHCIRKEIYSACDELLAVTTAAYKGHLLISETDANGNTTKHQYDAAGRPLSTIKPDTILLYQYDSLGRKTKIIQRINEELTHVSVTAYEYDLLNRITEERLEDFEGNIFTRTTYGYDDAGRRTSITVFNDHGPCTTRTLYNPQGQVSCVIDAIGNETHTHYNYEARNMHGQRVLEITMVDALASATAITHDSLGRAVSTIHKDPLGREIAKSRSYFDGKGNRTKRIDTIKREGCDDREITTEWGYDTLGRLVSLTEASRRHTTYIYNRYGQKENEILADGITLVYTYDPLGRIEKYTASDASFAYHYTYDPVGNPIQILDEKNELTTTRTYDSANRLMSETLANGLTLGYHYDGLSRLIRLDLPDSSAIEYLYNTSFLRIINRLSSEGKILYSHQYLAYDLTGHLLKAQMIGEAGHLVCQWDQLMRLSNLETDIFQETISADGFDAVGNLVEKQRKDVLGETSCQYTYDARYQISSESGHSEHTYQYDSLDNRVAKDEESCELDDLNQILHQGEIGYSYDERGNRLSQDPDRQYSYDALGRLIQATIGKRQYRYVYDAFNRRLSKSRYTSNHLDFTERYLYREQMDIGTVNALDQITQLRVLGQGLGAEIGAAVAIELREKVYAPVHDHSGHVVGLVKAKTGQLAEVYRYSVFGEEERYVPGYFWGWRKVGGHSANPWRFASKRCDPETGLVNFGRRYYDPLVGRWLTPDPVGYQDGPNLYAYVHNSPLTHVDLYGLLTEENGPGKEAGEGWFSKARRTIGDSLCSACWHGCPVEPLQRMGMAAARAISGLGFSTPRYATEKPSSGWHSTLDPDKPHCNMMLVTGQCNIFEDCHGAVVDMSAKFGNCNVGYIHNSSRGIVRDTMESIGLALGLHTKSLRECVSRLRSELAYRASMGITDPLHLHAHSQGGLLVYRALQQLTKDEAGMLRVTTYGSAKLISDSRLDKRENIIARTDFVTLIADPFGYLSALSGSEKYNVRWVGPRIGIPFADHAWKNGSYAEELNKGYAH